MDVTCATMSIPASWSRVPNIESTEAASAKAPTTIRTVPPAFMATSYVFILPLKTVPAEYFSPELPSGGKVPGGGRSVEIGGPELTRVASAAARGQAAPH